MADREYVMLEDKNGKEILPVTDGNGVFVEGGTKKLDKKLTEINEQLDTIANTVRYSTINSLTELKNIVEIEKKSILLDKDLILNESITLTFNKCGIQTDNNSKIYYENDNALISFSQNSFNFNVDIINKTTTRTLPLMRVLIDTNDSEWKMYSKFNNFKLEGNNKKCDGLFLYSPSPTTGVFLNDFSTISINMCNNGIKLQIGKSGSEYGWINGNTFSNITILNCICNIKTISVDATGRSRVTGNRFNNLILEPGDDFLFDDEGKNVFNNVQIYDLHASHIKDITKNKFGKQQGYILNQNEQQTYIFNTEENEMLPLDEYHEIGFFSKLDTNVLFVKINITSNKYGVGDVGNIYLYPNTDIVTNKKTSWTAYYDNQKVHDQVNVYTCYDSETNSVRVFLKSVSEKIFWGVKERKFFTINYSPYKFNSTDMAKIEYAEATKSLIGSAFGYSGIVDFSYSNNQTIIRLSDGTQICYSGVVNKTLPSSIAASTQSSLLDLGVTFEKPFTTKPHISVSGRLSKSDGVMTYVNYDICGQTKTSLGKISFNNTCNYPIDTIIDFSFYAIGRWK